MAFVDSVADSSRGSLEWPAWAGGKEMAWLPALLSPLLAYWGNRVHLDPKHLRRENLTQQAGQSTLWTLEKDRHGEVFIGTSLGKSGD